MAKAYDKWRTQAIAELEREPDMGAQALMRRLGVVGILEYGTVYRWVKNFREEQRNG